MRPNSPRFGKVWKEGLEKMKVYIAAPYSEVKRAREIKSFLEGSGITVTSRWIDTWTDKDLGTEEMRDHALTDLADVIDANVVLVVAEDQSKTGGMHVETGIAIALLKGVVVLGEKQNVFHHLGMPVVTDLPTALGAIQEFAPVVREGYENMVGAVRLDRTERPTNAPTNEETEENDEGSIQVDSDTESGSD